MNKNYNNLKTFSRWNNLKYFISSKESIRPLYCKAGEIWWCSIGYNIGVEQSCINKLFNRPVLIIKVFNTNMFWGIPITSKKFANNKLSSKYYLKIDNISRVQGALIISQLRLFDTKRLVRKINQIDKYTLSNIKNRVISLLK